MLFLLSSYRIFILFYLFIYLFILKFSMQKFKSLTSKYIIWAKDKRSLCQSYLKKEKSSICCIHWRKVTFSIIIGCVFTCYTHMQQDFFIKKRPKIQWFIGDEFLHCFNMFSLHNQSIPRSTSFIIFLVINLKKKKKKKKRGKLIHRKAPFKNMKTTHI